MGCRKNCISWSGNKDFAAIFLLFLLVSSFTHVSFLAEGRAIQKQVEETTLKGTVEEVGEKRSLIGSRPPRCERKCRACEHCEAIQVPVVPQFRLRSGKRPRFSANPKASSMNVVCSRGDGVSNYKPMSWKCKCGDLIFNPRINLIHN